MRRISFVFMALVLAFPAFAQESQAWPDGSRRLLELARQDPSFARAEAMGAAFVPTTDGRSFFVVWEPEQKPDQWIVSLPGTHGLAPKDLTIWEPHLKGRRVGMIVLQWWMGSGDGTDDYYAPQDMYREIDRLLGRMGVAPGSAMLHGFSRGSANIYAVAALDRVRGRKYFSLYAANAGGASLDYPPTHAIDEGAYGPRPFGGARWATSCGRKDPNPERDGCPAMRRTAAWLKARGAQVVLAIEDPAKGHGALHLNPANARKLLDAFLK